MADASAASGRACRSGPGCWRRNPDRGCRRGSAASTSAGARFSAILSPSSGSSSCVTLVLCAIFADAARDALALCRRRPPHRAPAPAGRKILARHRRPGARHLFAHRLRLAADPARGGPRLRHRRADRPRRRHHRRLCRRLGRCRAEPRDRHLPRLPAARAGARLRCRARTGNRERHHRHRHHDLAALRAHRARRDAHHPQLGIHPGGAAAGRIVGAHHPEARRAALPLLGHRARDARHGGHHPDRRRPRLPRPRRAAAASRMGRDDRRRPALPDRPMVGRGDARASRSSSSASASTCSATGCATCSTRRPRDERDAAPRGRGPARALPSAARHGRSGARRLLLARPRAARHRRRIRLGQIADRPRHPRPDAAARRGHGEAARVRRDRPARSQPARAPPPARQPHDHGDAGPEILARPGDAGRQADRRGLPRAHEGVEGRGAREGARHARGGAHPRSAARALALSARAFRRHGPARDDRHDARHRPRPADRRRADLGARRDGAARSAAHPRRPRRASAAWG